MKRFFLFAIALLAWFALSAQFILMIENRIASIPETIIRFFSFFTILTNTLVAVYFTALAVNRVSLLRYFFDKPGAGTAITLYITIVGLVYQVLLRFIWEPAGLQMVVDELLHSVVPFSAVLYWFLYENKAEVRWSQIPGWLIYPVVYLLYIMIRGHYSGFYPYPFVNAAELGYAQVLINTAGLVILFLLFAAIFAGISTYKIKVKPGDHAN